jgi:hypothetical protein
LAHRWKLGWVKRARAGACWGAWGPPAGPVSCCVAVCLAGVERVERGAAAVVET